MRARLPGQLLTYVFNFFEADDCHCCTSNHEAHVDNEEKMEKFVTQRTLRESPMRNLGKKKKISWNQSIFLELFALLSKSVRNIGFFLFFFFASIGLQSELFKRQCLKKSDIYVFSFSFFLANFFFRKNISTLIMLFPKNKVSIFSWT